jgi:hypothetical protein
MLTYVGTPPVGGWVGSLAEVGRVSMVSDDPLDHGSLIPRLPVRGWLMPFLPMVSEAPSPRLVLAPSPLVSEVSRGPASLGEGLG